ncbi:M48 family metallopeptidase [Halomicrobium salinisoli]|uniref:M48 family metallopeptidase n=1 Tax=Halomicrobium salinisoli TaxID=2878391 RepID=UPI001CF06B96|nr:M48 family metalloprotease [Halomicrobium salinisoli]
MVAGRRLALAAAGVAGLAFYLAVAYVCYLAAVALWANRPDPVAVVVGVLLGALLLGYLSYLTGTATLRRRLDARPLPYRRAPGVHDRLDRLCDRMGVARPELLVARMAVPNAVAIGGRRTAIVIDDRLFRLISGAQLEALLAHELAHLENGDAFVQTLAFSVARTVVGVASVAVLPIAFVAGGLARAVALLRGRPNATHRSLLARVERWAIGLVGALGLLVTLAALAYSRRRELAADDRAAELTDPLALARTLRRIERASKPNPGLLTPLYVHGDDDGPLSRLLATHPPMGERIDRLVERAESDGPRRSGRIRR